MKTLLFFILYVAVSHSVPAAQQPAANGGVLRLSRDAALRDGRLETGTALVSSARGLVRAKPEVLKVGDVELACRGTALIAKTPQGGVKVTCLEGQLIVSVAKARVRLDAGRMVLIDRSMAEVPETVEVNLERLLDTSALTRHDRDALPGAAAIEREIQRQRKALARGRLVASGVALKDSGHTASVSQSSPTTADQRGASSSGASSASSSPSSSASTGSSVVGNTSVQSATACA